ncbi:MAG: FimV/HubP family polar landmark protein [Gammaproteobacteria bacterium]
MKKIIVFLLLSIFSSVVIASHQKYHVAYLESKGKINSKFQQQSSIKQEYLQAQAQLRLAKLQNQHLVEKLEQLLTQNQVLQNLNTGQQQTMVQQEKVIHQLEARINLNLQQQSAFASSHLIFERSLLNFPWFNQLMQQLDLPLTITGTVLIIILLLLLLLYKSFYRPVLKKQLSNDAVTETHESAKNVNYKYLAGEDVVTAKLNLAHAYYDMEDFSSAKEVLVDIIREGTAEQQEEARNLLVKINKLSGT